MFTAEHPYIQLKSRKRDELSSYLVKTVLTQEELRIIGVGIAHLSGSWNFFR